MKNWVKEWWGMILIVSFIVLLIVGAMINYSRHFQACLDDGYKPWECHAMLNGGGRWK